MPKELDEIQYDLCKAIVNGIKNAQTYPIATIQADGSLALECNENIDKFQYFADIFATLCEQYNITKLPDTEAFYSREDLYRNSQKITKFKFNISPEQFDQLLIAESDNYRGYRNAGNSGSILLLANPHLEAFKEGSICAFPVLAMGDNQVMLRIAGCNASELISTQLTYIITQHLPPEAYQHSTKRYGHWGAEITNLILDGLSSETLVEAAIKCFSNSEQDLFLQSMEGFDVLPIRPESITWLQEIDSSNKTIYRLLGVVSPEELTQLKSLEIPSEIYLSQLATLIKLYLSDYAPGGNRGPGGKYYHPDNAPWDLEQCEKLRTSLSNIDMILTNIELSKRDQLGLNESDSTTDVSPFAFFQPGDEVLTPKTNSQSIEPPKLK